MYILCIWQKTIILSLFKIDTLNVTVYILPILTCSLKTYVIRLRSLVSMNIFFLYNCKETAEKKLLKYKNNQKEPFAVFQNRCSWKFPNMQRKTPALESCMPATLLKRTSTQLFCCKYYKIFKNSFFYRTPPVAVSK